MRNLDLALIGNCTLGALIDERAEMVWENIDLPMRSHLE